MDSPQNQAVVFDFGGVLIDWNPRHLYRRYFAQPDEMEHFLREIGFSEWNAQQDRGRPFAEGVAELSRRFPQHADLIRLYHEQWPMSLAGPIDGSIEILRALKGRGVALYGLSNWSAETFPLARAQSDFLDLLDMYIISGDVGLIKPDPAIFRLLLERTGLPASACLLVDDSPVNTHAAAALGFDTVLFRSPEQLRTELQARALL